MNELYASTELIIALLKNDLIHTQLIKRLQIDDDRYRDYAPQIDPILVNFMYLPDGADRTEILERYRKYKKEMPIVNHQNRMQQLEEMATDFYNNLVS